MPLSIKNYLLLVFLLLPMLFFAQIFKTERGNLNSVNGVKRYKVIFEYAENLKIPKYTSEERFLFIHSRKKELKKPGSGNEFKNLWYKNRAKLFEPKFIQEFNFFNLKEKQITVAKNISDAAYTMVVKTSLIDPGNSNYLFKKNARLEVTIQVYKSDTPEEILYTTEIIDVHSRGASVEDYDRIMSAYAELGRSLSKHFTRKT